MLFLVTWVNLTTTSLTHHGPLCLQIMFRVLYAASLEVFPAKHRGIGGGLTAAANRIFGILGRPSLNHLTF